MNPSISKIISQIYRMGQQFYDAELKSLGLSSGHPFFLIEIKKQPGIHLVELATQVHFDKGTTARAIRHLIEVGYVTPKQDEHDARIYHLYLSETGEQAASQVETAILKWHDILLANMNTKQIESCCHTLTEMSKHANQYLQERRMKHG